MSVAVWPKIEFTEERLDNGLRLVLSEDHLAPIAAVNLWYNVGSKNEVPGRTGLAHLFEHMMFEGTPRVPKGEWDRLLAAIGGVNNASTSWHRTNYFEFAPSNHLEMLLYLEADRMGTLLEGLHQETLDNQRDVVKNERRWSIDNRPYGTWIEKMQNSLFPEGHPYHHEIIGSMDDLSEASLEDVREFFRTYYAPNNAVLTIAGDFEPDEVGQWVSNYFGPIPANPDRPAAPAVGLEMGDLGDHREVVPDRVPLSRVYVGFRSPPEGSREADVIQMATAVLATGKGSRLYKSLVRARETAQDVQFFSIPLDGVSFTTGWATARPDVSVDKIEAELNEIVESMVADPVTDEELARARSAVERELIDHLMTVASRADWLSEHATVFGDPAKANERLPALMSVTAKEIQACAVDVFRSENRVRIVYVPQTDPEEEA